MSERHLREARELLGAVSPWPPPAALAEHFAQRIAAAELRGVRAGLAAARARACHAAMFGESADRAATHIGRIDPASVDVAVDDAQ